MKIMIEASVYNKLIKLKQEFCEKFDDIVKEIDK